MTLWSRSEFQCRSEKPLPILSGDFGKFREAGVLFQHGFEPGLEACLGLSPRYVRPEPSQHLHPTHTAVQHTVEAGNGLRRHGGGNPNRWNLANVDASE